MTLVASYFDFFNGCSFYGKGEGMINHIQILTKSTLFVRTNMDLTSPRLMGIINLTTDSFYDGGQIKSDRQLLSKVEGMLAEGADILDVGAYSSRPGADDVSIEIERSVSAKGISLICKEFPEAMVSVDTFRSGVVRAACEAGAKMVNDISGGDLDERMFDVVAELDMTYIMMHMRGNPRTMTRLTEYNNLVEEVMDSFRTKIKGLRSKGVTEIIIDPGFGFAKTTEQNFELLNQLYLLQQLEVPILAGVSRKSMIFKTLGNSAAEALNGTTALNMTCLIKGANILRVHDIKEAKETAMLYEAMMKG